MAGQVGPMAKPYWDQVVTGARSPYECRTLYCPEDPYQPKPTSGWGNISYAYNWVGLSGQGTNIFRAAPSPAVKPGRVRFPSQTIVLVDSGINLSPWPPVGYFYCRAWYDPWNGYPYPRHRGACNVVWVDGHVSPVVAPDGTHQSLYWPTASGHPVALGNVWPISGSYWYQNNPEANLPYDHWMPY